MAEQIIAARTTPRIPLIDERALYEWEVWLQLMEMIKRPLTQDERELLTAAAPQ